MTTNPTQQGHTMTTTLNLSPAKLAEFNNLVLHSGGHNDFEDGHCAMEVVSWLADEGFTDAPTCASPVIRRYTIRLNDRWDDEKRQQLKPYLLRMIGTGGDGLDPLREQIAAEWVGRRLLGPWLRLAGLTGEADRLEAAGTPDEVRAGVYAARDAAWARRQESRAELRAKVRAEVAKRLEGKPAADAAAAVADAAVADAAADAAAVAVAVVAVADAAADAAVADAAVADAAAVAVAAAAAVAVADAAADAAAVAVAAAAADAGENTYTAAYRAARAYYRDNPLPVMEQITALAAEQEPLALELLDLLIDPTQTQAAS